MYFFLVPRNNTNDMSHLIVRQGVTPVLTTAIGGTITSNSSDTCGSITSASVAFTGNGNIDVTYRSAFVVAPHVFLQLEAATGVSQPELISSGTTSFTFRWNGGVSAGIVHYFVIAGQQH
jgi:hypothetical protein